jgi:hypothetical protein
MTTIGCTPPEIPHPARRRSPPGLPHVPYRPGDFGSFRRAMLRPRGGEHHLPNWRPGARGDLLLQIVDWWAYIADVLSLYAERSLNENLVGTADLDESVRLLIDILGYRPRPGLGASAHVAVLLSSTRPLTLPAGFAISSKPSPGTLPEIYETSEDVTLSPSGQVAARPAGTMLDKNRHLFLDTVSTIQPGELLVLARRDRASDPLLVEVLHTMTREDAAGRSFTEITPVSPIAIARNPKSTDYELLRSGLSMGTYGFPTTDVVTQYGGGCAIRLASLMRSIRPGQMVVVQDKATPLNSTLAAVTGVTETTLNAGTTANPIPILHSVIVTTCPREKAAVLNQNKASLNILANWQPAGQLRDAPVATFSGQSSLFALGRDRFAQGTNSVIMEGADGAGFLATGSSNEALTELDIANSGTAPPTPIELPIRVLNNVVRLTRGKTVQNELLGVGQQVTRQEFVLKQSPLTYLPRGDGYVSTLRVYVAGEEWKEVPSFFGQAADARVFVTREDEEQKTHIIFGDWENGAGLPTGAAVVANYRCGSGGSRIEPGLLTVIDKPVPGVASVRQPIAAGGGADPERMTEVRTLAPRSVLTFGRAISSDDYEAIAARAPGVTRVRSYFAWDGAEQRAAVSLYVGDDLAAVESARTALSLSADPNRPVSVFPATRVDGRLDLSLLCDATRIPADVAAAVRASLTDDKNGPLGTRALKIGQGIFRSRLFAACLAVPGVRSVETIGIELRRASPGGWVPAPGTHVAAARHEFLSIAADQISISVSVATDG